jgi:RimJ/RimL family protein N-acetyltransferase
VERLPDNIASPRLTLRRWVAADAAALSAAITASIEHLRPWMPWISAEPVSLADRVALIDQWKTEWERGGDEVIGAFLDGVVVGSTGFHRRRGPGALEIGYWVHVDHTRKGFATEIAASLTNLAFTVPDIERVEIHHDKANFASAGVPRSLGYTYAGETLDAVTSPGEAGIDCRWVINRHEWDAKVDGSFDESRVGSDPAGR